MSLAALAFVLVYFLGFFKAITDKPIFGLYTYIFTFYLHPPAHWWGNVLPDLRWSLLAAAVTLISAILHRKKYDYPLFKMKETKIFAAFVIYVGLQTLWAINISLHLEYVFLCLKFLLLIILIQCCVREEKDVVGFILANLIGCAYMGYQGIGGGRLEGLGPPGLDGSNALAQHMAVILVFSSFLLLSKPGKWFLPYAFLLVLVLNGVILTESRSVIIALGASSLFFLAFSAPAVRRRTYQYFILAAVAFSMLIGPSLISKMSTIVSDEESGVEQDRSAESRLVVIKAQWAMFLDKPVIGYGHRGTLLLSSYYVPEQFLASTGETKARSSHNFLMTLLVDHGLIGAGLYLLLIWCCVKYIFSLRKFAFEDADIPRLHIIATGLITSLVFLTFAGMGSNNKVLEIDIWLYALIPLICEFLKNKPSLDSQTMPGRA